MNTINLPGSADENEPVWLNMKDSVLMLIMYTDPSLNTI